MTWTNCLLTKCSGERHRSLGNHGNLFGVLLKIFIKMLMFPNGLILARWSLREALFENLCVWLNTTRAGSKMVIVDTHSPRL